MKIFFRYQTFRFIWLAKPPGRHLHRDHQLWTHLTLADFEAIHRCERSLPKNFNFAADVLDQWSQKEKTGERPVNPALWWVNGKGDEVKWSFRELSSFSQKAANVLTKPCGLQRGDRVAVILPRIPEWWLLNVACIRTGIIFMPGTIQLTAKDILYRLRASKAKCIVASEEVAPVVESIAVECPDLKAKLLVSSQSRNGWLSFQELFQLASEEHSCVETGSEEPMAIYFTSGTTGSPKMAQHSQSSLSIGSTLCGRYWLDLKSSDIMWNMSDTGWVKAAIGSVFSSWLHGACVFVHQMVQFDVDTFLDTLTTYPITILCSPPTVYRMLVQKDLKRYLGRNLHLNHKQYLSSQQGIICSNQKGQEIKLGMYLPPGKKGKCLRLKSTRPLLFSLNDNPEKTAATIRGDFYVTGDRGVMDSDGYFWFVGRADDVIISSGYRIGPFEVESALIEHPAVVESAVVSSPDQIRGEVDELSHNIFLSIRWNFVQELPRHITGKINATF
uniref:medium-chain acyl-CoA ligase n=1 Tax=Aotus nancymaae TaxID=37293 RepID=A0A2K5D4U6_AOTNA